MESVWAVIRRDLANRISESNRKTWIDPLIPLRMDGDILYLGCPNRFFMGWIREHYLARITEAVMSLNGGAPSVRAVELEIAQASKPAPASGGQRPVQRELPNMEVYGRAPLRFNQRFTFDRFIVGTPNQYAYAAARAMAAGRELNADTLYLLSDHGLGKSHLSQALGQSVLQKDGRRRVYYLTAEEFTNELVHSIKNKCVEGFKDKFRKSCDVLVMEEVHFLSGKEKVQNELCYTLDCLIERNKKVVFTSSLLPKDIPRLGRHFASRLSSSLISTIEAPDYETRVRIIKQKADENGLSLRDDVLHYLAKGLTRDVRHIESCLISLSAKSRLLKRPLDLSLAVEVLGELVDGNDGAGVDRIQREVCRYYQVSMEDLKSRSRRKHHVLPRNVGMYLCRKLTDLSLESIGKAFGRNHSTVLYSVNLIENRTRRDHRLKHQVELISDQAQDRQPG